MYDYTTHSRNETQIVPSEKSTTVPMTSSNESLPIPSCNVPYPPQPNPQTLHKNSEVYVQWRSRYHTHPYQRASLDNCKSPSPPHTHEKQPLSNPTGQSQFNDTIPRPCINSKCVAAASQAEKSPSLPCLTQTPSHAPTTTFLKVWATQLPWRSNQPAIHAPTLTFTASTTQVYLPYHSIIKYIYTFTHLHIYIYSTVKHGKHGISLPLNLRSMPPQPVEPDDVESVSGPTCTQR